jgi:uncharacterized protein HemX
MGWIRRRSIGLWAAALGLAGVALAIYALVQIRRERLEAERQLQQLELMRESLDRQIQSVERRLERGLETPEDVAAGSRARDKSSLGPGDFPPWYGGALDGGRWRTPR